MTAKGRFTVELSRGAESDLDSIWNYLAQNASKQVAEQFLESILDRAAKLERYPFRGSIPWELEGLDAGEVRQISLNPYRIIYLIEERVVAIIVIADGRRDIRTLLEQRIASR